MQVHLKSRKASLGIIKESPSDQAGITDFAHSAEPD